MAEHIVFLPRFAKLSTPCACGKDTKDMRFHHAVVSWLVQPGARVRAGEALCSCEVEKSTFDVLSPGEGTVLRLLADEGASCGFDTPLCILSLA